VIRAAGLLSGCACMGVAPNFVFRLLLSLITLRAKVGDVAKSFIRLAFVEISIFGFIG
jgi:hypothetical protein